MLDRKDIAIIVGVVPGDDVVSAFAKSRGVNVVQCSDINSDEFISLVKSLGAELLINVFFLQRYRARLLNVPRFGAINVHPSKLPNYRGRDCVRWAMVNGEKEIGVTVHQMDEALDTGDILLQESITVQPDDCYLDVLEKLKITYPRIVLEAVRILSRGEVKRRTQTPGEGTYFPHRLPVDGRINWSDKSLDIYNLIRASCEPGFYAYSHLGERKIFITKASMMPGSDYESIKGGRSQISGRVLDYDYADPSRFSVLVGTADGVISIQKYFADGAQETEGAKILKRGDRFS